MPGSQRLGSIRLHRILFSSPLTPLLILAPKVGVGYYSPLLLTFSTDLLFRRSVEESCERHLRQTKQHFNSLVSPVLCEEFD
jgi:hypothetical protein